jgi:hypothetical protein
MVEGVSLDARSPAAGEARGPARQGVEVRESAHAGCGRGGQVRSTARQLGPGLGLTGPPPINVFPFMSQIEAWPLVF